MLSEVAAILKFGELGLVALALFGAYRLLRALPVEMGAAIGKAIVESELRTTDRLNDLEASLRGNCRYGHTSPPRQVPEEEEPVVLPRPARLPQYSRPR
jgi:hypothetical protein